ncbi:MAG TPA: hypothetical protein VMT67_04870 [Terriglobales bacterium]|nr:hypothetical protein [Terriglobales bacterium]
MLWWFLILGVGLALVVWVAVSLFVRVRQQLKATAASKPESNGVAGALEHDENAPPEV